MSLVSASFFCSLSYKFWFGAKKSSHCVKKCIYFDKTTRFLLEIAKKTFSIEISKNNAHTFSFHFTWSVKTTQKLFRSFLIHNKRYSELLSVFDLFPVWDETPEFATVFLRCFLKTREKVLFNSLFKIKKNCKNLWLLSNLDISFLITGI